MKNLILTCLICVIFSMLSANIGFVYAFSPTTIEFIHNEKIFTYNLDDNIPTISQFDQKHRNNKYHRFGTTEEKISLLKHMTQIGIDKSIALRYVFPNLDNTLNKIEKNIYVKPQNAVLSINERSKDVFSIQPEIVGISLDKETLISQIYNNFINNLELKFFIPTKETIPKITKDELKKHTYLRSDFATSIASSSSDRKHNIKNALFSLNKIEILPNEIFSFNNIVGKRTIENGYRQAKIIVNNEFVDGIGGGVCQVSSTLYNSALLAGLEIIESNKHSKQVSYVNAGFDAMVNFGSSDLKFRNNTSEKLTIITNFSSTTARVRIFGECPHNIEYKLSNEITNIVEPNEETLIDEKEEYTDKVIYQDQYFFLKKPQRGMEIKTYREKYVNNERVSKELLRHDKFKVQNGIKVYGNKTRESENKKSTDDSALFFYGF